MDYTAGVVENVTLTDSVRTSVTRHGADTNCSDSGSTRDVANIVANIQLPISLLINIKRAYDIVKDWLNF